MVELTGSDPLTEGEKYKPQLTFCFLDTTTIQAGEHIVPAKLEGELAKEFADLHMIENDFAFALDCFKESDKIGLPDPSNVYSKALISAGVTAYSRPFKSGVRQTKLKPSYFSETKSFDLELHGYLVSIRDKHVSHSVNEFERSASVGVMVGVPRIKWRPAGVGVTKLHAIGISKRIIDASVIQLESMLATIRKRIDEIRPTLFDLFKQNCEKTSTWEIAPIASFPKSVQISNLDDCL